MTNETKNITFHVIRVKVSVEYKCIMDVFTLSLCIAQVWAICVISINGSCPKFVTI